MTRVAGERRGALPARAWSAPRRRGNPPGRGSHPALELLSPLGGQGPTDEGGQVMNRQPGLLADGRGVGWHAGALENDRADLGVATGQQPRRLDMPLAGTRDVQLLPIAKDHPLPLSKRSSHAAPLTGLPSRASRFPAACPGGPGLTGSPRGQPGDPIGACSDGEPSWGTPAAAGARPARPPERSPTRFRVAARIRARPRRTSRSRRRGRSHVRTVPILARVRWRRSGSTRITPVPKGQRSGARPLRLPLGKPTVPTKPASWGAPDPATVELARPRALPAPGGPRPRSRWRRLPWRGGREAGLAGTPWRSGATTLARLLIHALGPLGPVPAPAETGARRRLLRCAGLAIGVEIGLGGPDRPVGGGAAATPLPPDGLPLLRGWAQSELERLQRPAVRGRAPTRHHLLGARPSPGPPDGRRHAGRRAGHRGGSGARFRLGPGPRRPRRDRPPPAALPERRVQPPPPRPRTAPSGPEARPRSWSRSGHAARPGTSDAFRSGPSRSRSEGARRRAPPGPPKRQHPPPAGPDRSVDRQRTRGRSRRGVPRDQVTGSPGRDGKRARREAPSRERPGPVHRPASPPPSFGRQGRGRRGAPPGSADPQRTGGARHEGHPRDAPQVHGAGAPGSARHLGPPHRRRRPGQQEEVGGRLRPRP